MCEFDHTMRNRLDLFQSSYTLDEVEQLKRELRYRMSHNEMLRAIRLCSTLNLLGLEYNEDTEEFEEGDGTEWILKRSDFTGR